MKAILHPRSSILAATLAALTQISILILQPASAQSPRADYFNPEVGSAETLVVQADGRILVGGLVIAPDGQTRHLERVNADGTLDTGFNPGANNWVLSLAAQADGKILVGGVFTRLGGQPCAHIGRVNADGTLDTEFNPGADDEVYSLAVQADGKILVAGYFSTLGGQTRNYVGRLNADGTLDTGFNPGADGEVVSLALQADGKILVGGEFTWLGGQPRSNIARLNADGTLDTEFNPGADYAVYSLAVQADGKILVGGRFTWLGGQTRNSLARLNADGSLDTGFNPGAERSDGYSPVVGSLAVQADRKILVGGGFTTLGGQPRSSIARLNADGTLDSGFNPGVDGSVRSLAVQADGKILAGGYFSTLGGRPRSGFGRLNNTAPATQSLRYDVSTITWLRGGTSPEVWRTTFEVSANGTDWSSLGAGTRIPGAWQLPGVSLPPNSALRARGYVSGGRGNGSGWFVEAYYGKPVFSFHPTSRTNDAGTTATFSVVAGGSEPLSYEWRKDGSPLADGGSIAGARTAVLMLANVLGGDAGDYSVVVSNGFGSVTSALATLTAMDPVIAAQPLTQNRQPGQSVTFSVTAEGTEPLSFQWRKEGVPLVDGGKIAGARTTLLTLTNVLGGDAGGYSVVVHSSFGSVTSAAALLTVVTLTEALNAINLTWTSGGDAVWLAQSTTTHDGFWAAQSGPISDRQETWMQTTVTGPGPLSFWWKVSSEPGYDYLNFYINGVFQSGISGSVDWHVQNYTLGTGTQVLRWRYKKDGNASTGQDRGWVDEVSFTLPATGISLSVSRNGSNLVLNWTGGQGPYQVEQTTQLGDSDSWQNLGAPVTTNSLSVPLGSGSLFLRVRGK